MNAPFSKEGILEAGGLESLDRPVQRQSRGQYRLQRTKERSVWRSHRSKP